jgi:hypothetical protein
LRPNDFTKASVNKPKLEDTPRLAARKQGDRYDGDVIVRPRTRRSPAEREAARVKREPARVKRQAVLDGLNLLVLERFVADIANPEHKWFVQQVIADTYKSDVSA